MRVFVTGATGFLGQALVRSLRARGHDITALLRTPRRPDRLPDAVRSVTGVIEEPETYRAALPGHDVFVHAAALVKMWAPDRSLFDRVNVEGSEGAILAARAAGIGKFVYASSFIALGPSNGKPLAEDDLRRTSVPHNDYERTKIAADAMARRYLDEGYPVFILYPGVLYGPGPLTDGNLIAKNIIPFLSGRMPFGAAIETWSYAYIDDVVEGFLKVIEGSPPQRRYILGGDNRGGDDFYEALHQASGRRPPRFKVPPALASATGYGEYLMARLFGRTPRLLTHEVARIYRRSWAYDSGRAVRDFGYTITPLEEGLRRTVASLRDARLIP
jgi:farnesol dehydrogenase